MVKEISKYDARVVAMAVDCDGTVNIIRHHSHGSLGYVPNVEFANTTRKLVEAVKDMVDDSVSVKDRQVQGRNCKRGYYINWRSLDDVYIILTQIRPYLIRKGEVADVVMDFCEIRLEKLQKDYHAPYDEEERKLYECARELNMKGIAGYPGTAV